MTTEPLAAGLQERLSDHRFRSGAYWVLSQLALCYPIKKFLDCLRRD
jgi:hypothetical protein